MKGSRSREGVWVGCLAKFFEDFSLASMVESVGGSFGFSVCVLVVPLSVPDVTFHFSNVNVDCGVVLSGSECEFCGAADSFFLAKSEDMNFDGALVKAPPASRRKLVSPTPQQNPPPPIESTPRRREDADQEYCSFGMEFWSVDGTRQSGYGENGSVLGQE